MIGVINLGNSNIQSVANALDSLNIEYLVTDNCRDFEKCTKYILPGVGSFSSGILRLEELCMLDGLRNEVLNKNKPILGICLGMQMFFESSEESPGVHGLHFISGSVVKIPSSVNYKTPRIGWAESNINFKFLGLEAGQFIDFYYVHSFHAAPQDPDIVAITSDDLIVSAIQYGNIYGCQFHPEKSYKAGLTILSEFTNLDSTNNCNIP